MRLISALAPVAIAAALTLTSCAPAQTPTAPATQSVTTAPESVLETPSIPGHLKFATCQEDEPCWNCHTMGNKMCFPAPIMTHAATLTAPATAPAPDAEIATDTITAPAAAPAPVVCQEDEPCWDCTTMGNKICGTPAAAPVAGSQGSVPVDYATLPKGGAWAGVGTAKQAAAPVVSQPVAAPVTALTTAPAPSSAPVASKPAAPVTAPATTAAPAPCQSAPVGSVNGVPVYHKCGITLEK
jgi:hypothetical protein